MLGGFFLSEGAVRAEASNIFTLGDLIPAALSQTWVRIAPVIMTSDLLWLRESNGSLRCGIVSINCSLTLSSSKSRFTSRSGTKPLGIPFASFLANPMVSPSALARKSSMMCCLAV